MAASVDKMGETIIDVPPLSFGATFKTIPPWRVPFRQLSGGWNRRNLIVLISLQ